MSWIPVAIAALIVAGTPSPAVWAAQGDHLAAGFPGTGYRNVDGAGFPEPSGIVFHPGRDSLFVCGDEGDLIELAPDGTARQQTSIGGDFEGITCDAASGMLYVAVEGGERILEVDPTDLAVRRAFTINRTFEGQTVMAEGGQGIEGITFVPQPDHPEGGTFLVANQSLSLDDREDRSAIFEVLVPLKTGPQTGESRAQIVRSLSFGITDLSGLHYDTQRNRLYVVSDSNNLFLETTLEGEVLNFWACPGANQEGVTVDAAGHVYFPQDSGGIIRLEWIRDE